MLENCLDLTAEMPVMLTIPSERVLGPGYGKLFCVIPRGENTSLAVNHITGSLRATACIRWRTKSSTGRNMPSLFCCS